MAPGSYIVERGALEKGYGSPKYKKTKQNTHVLAVSERGRSRRKEVTPFPVRIQKGRRILWNFMIAWRECAGGRDSEEKKYSL